MMSHKLEMDFYEQIKNSSFREAVTENIVAEFREKMRIFMQNAVQRGEIKALPIEVSWSILYAPLYNLIRFHQEGKSITGSPFVLTDEILWQTFDLVLKGIKN